MTLAALLLDLGDTLVRGDRVIEHVPEALEALAALHTGAGPLPLALVSDYTMPQAHDPAEITRLVAEYRGRVASYGLARFFQPAERHMTLSTEVGVTKPDPAVFRAALLRLGLPAELPAAMFITEDAAHVAAARRLGMTAWQLGVDFTDWSQPPLYVACAIGDTDPARVRAAYALRLQVVFREQLAEIQRVDLAARRTHATLAGEPPREVELELDARGDVAALRHVHETPREQGFREALEDTGAIAAPGEPLAPGQTHEAEPGPEGPRPRRKRFSMT
ncbi:MAG TPA: HAD family hydrolase [Kofleriaceae bacterium]|nr:HAD family hydrolase [Kofleriaceae bacterium]